MCGRYSLTSPAEGVRRVFGFLEQPNLAARYNIAPTQDVAAVRLGEDDKRHFVWLKWGLVPNWAKEAKVGSRMINARAETLAEKPAFRSAFRSRRCLVAADGFYEWRKEGEGAKQPYRITLADGGPFGFAGLWESWRDPADGARVESCTIVTTVANERLAPIHPRMPVILAPSDFAAWLDPAYLADAAQALLKAYPGEAMTAYKISTRVNRVADDDAAVIEPLKAGPEDPDAEADAPAEAQGRLF